MSFLFSVVVVDAGKNVVTVRSFLADKEDVKSVLRYYELELKGNFVVCNSPFDFSDILSDLKQEI